MKTLGTSLNLFLSDTPQSIKRQKQIEKIGKGGDLYQDAGRDAPIRIVRLDRFFVLNTNQFTLQSN